jgi:hypothetical protein
MGKRKQKTTLGIVQSKEGGGKVRKPKRFDTISPKTHWHYCCCKSRKRLFCTWGDEGIPRLGIIN